MDKIKKEINYSQELLDLHEEKLVSILDDYVKAYKNNPCHKYFCDIAYFIDNTLREYNSHLTNLEGWRDGLKCALDYINDEH